MGGTDGVTVVRPLLTAHPDVGAVEKTQKEKPAAKVILRENKQKGRRATKKVSPKGEEARATGSPKGREISQRIQ